MKTAKIIVGQSNTPMSESLAGLVANGECHISVVREGHQVLELAQNGHIPDMVILDSTLEGLDVLSIVSNLRSNSDFHFVPFLLVAPHQHETFYSNALKAGFDDILAEAFNPRVFEFRVRSLLKIKFSSEDHDDGESVLMTLARTLEAKDPYTLGHADRVSQFAVDLGRALNVKEFELEILRKGGMLHDIGKIAIPDAILLKPGRFTQEEFEVMKKHPLLGCEICEKLRSIKDALSLIRHHHEKLDGTGYPAGLKGDQIPALVRIVSVVDIYDALRSRRTYKEAFSVDKSLEILWEEANKGWWDKQILSVWEKIVRMGNPRSSVAA